MLRLRFSTSTLAGEEFVPWLASAGELAYSPLLPPERDYYFQYSWVIPGIFCAATRVRRHFWFGGPIKDSSEVKLLFAFWNRARQGELDALYVANGMAGPEGRLIADVKSQPHIDRGEAVLNRGVQKSGSFLFRRLTTPDIRSRLRTVHARSLADSVTSFNAVHCNVSRAETGWFNLEAEPFERLLDSGEAAQLFQIHPKT